MAMNPIIRALILSDMWMVTGWGLIGPIFAIFAERIPGGSVFVAGIASAIFLLVKSFTQIPFARWSDKLNNRKTFIVIGYSLFVLVPLGYIYVTNVWQLYLIQVLEGLGAALSYPAWLAVFSHHVDPAKEGYEWSVYMTGTGLGSAATAAIGGAVADFFGYNMLFIVVAVTQVAGMVVIYLSDIPDGSKLKPHLIGHKGKLVHGRHSHRHA